MEYYIYHNVSQLAVFLWFRLSHNFALTFWFRIGVFICLLVSALNLRDFNTGGRAKMEDNTSKQEPKVCWTRLLKPIFKTKANRTKTRWTFFWSRVDKNISCILRGMWIFCSLGKDSDFYNRELLHKLSGINAKLLIEPVCGVGICKSMMIL